MGKSSSHLSKNKNGLFSTTSKAISIFLFGLLIAALVVMYVNSNYRKSLIEKANTISAVIDSEKVASLKNPSSPTLNEDYDYLKAKLAAAKAANHGTRFTYLMDKTQEKGVYFLADSEPKDSEDYSPLGQEYPEATQALQDIFSNKRAFIEGPVHDRWGTWLSVLTPVYSNDGQLVAIAGMDIPAKEYIVLLVVSAVVPLSLAIAIAALLIIGDRIRKRQLDGMLFRSELISIASHELYTPLTGIRWGAESVLRYPLGDNQRYRVESIYSSVVRLQESIEEILQLARLQNVRGRELEILPADLTAMISNVLSVQKLPAAQRNVKLQFTQDWPKSLSINCDESQLRRVFNNIISNAIKYTRENTIVSVGYQQTPKAHIITITDQGIGIPKAEQKKVFGGFYRASNAISEHTSGSGMGLYLSRSVVEQHGGKLWFQSEQGKGTTVFIQLPL